MDTDIFCAELWVCFEGREGAMIAHTSKAVVACMHSRSWAQKAALSVFSNFRPRLCVRGEGSGNEIGYDVV